MCPSAHRPGERRRQARVVPDACLDLGLVAQAIVGLADDQRSVLARKPFADKGLGMTWIARHAIKCGKAECPVRRWQNTEPNARRRHRVD